MTCLAGTTMQLTQFSLALYYGNNGNVFKKLRILKEKEKELKKGKTAAENEDKSAVENEGKERENQPLKQKHE